jgi:cation transport ATPase
LSFRTACFEEFFYTCKTLGNIAFTGHTSLWLAILADTGATLLVIMNALRLLSGTTNFNPSAS